MVILCIVLYYNEGTGYIRVGIICFDVLIVIRKEVDDD